MTLNTDLLYRGFDLSKLRVAHFFKPYGSNGFDNKSYTTAALNVGGDFLLQCLLSLIIPFDLALRTFQQSVDFVGRSLGVNMVPAILGIIPALVVLALSLVPLTIAIATRMIATLVNPVVEAVDYLASTNMSLVNLK